MTRGARPAAPNGITSPPLTYARRETAPHFFVWKVYTSPRQNIKPDFIKIEGGPSPGSLDPDRGEGYLRASAGEGGGGVRRVTGVKGLRRVGPSWRSAGA